MKHLDRYVYKDSRKTAAPDGRGHKTVYADNPSAVRALMDLYAPEGSIVFDCTFGAGTFWRQVDTTLYRTFFTDLKADGIDCRELPYRDTSMDVGFFDPPYRYVEKKSTASHVDKQYALMESLRDTGLHGADGVIELYRLGINECARVVRVGGFLMVKCQDFTGDGKQWWTHVEVMEMLRHAGFAVVDLAVVVTEMPPPTRWKFQMTLRKQHSFFIVGRKVAHAITQTTEVG